MPKVKKTTTSQNTSRTFNIPNKLHRQAHNVRIKSALGAAKRKEKFERKREEAKDPSLREARMVTNLPATIESKRVWDETIPGALAAIATKPDAAAAAEPAEPTEDADEAAPTDDAQTEADALAAHEASQAAAADEEEAGLLFPTLLTPPTAPPHILLTTSRNNHVHAQAEELAALFPNTTYVPRHAELSVREIAKVAAAPKTIDPATGEPRKPYTHLIVASVDAKIIDALTIIVLPSGPSFRFSLSNYVPAKRISGHGRPTSHVPELILNNFLTPLGRNTAGLFQSLFPQLPEFKGRQVVTLHNQRDFIFFRRHRYVFRDKKEREKEVGFGLDTTRADGGKGMEGLGVKVGLQELGPRMTLKLRRVQKGVQEGVVWEWKAGDEKVRTKFSL
ncbi:anticodon-binding protein [Geopyxis carbonaria]|nr:anticodon-binding protein [Geopyxis carbonaria]